MDAHSPADLAVTDIVGVDTLSASKLHRVGISTVADMWAHAGDRSGRMDVSGTTGIPAERLADWAKKADLMRVGSIGPQDAALLDAAGITSLKQLRRRSAEALHAALEEADRKGRIVESLPSLASVGEWIEQATRLA